MSPMSVEDEVVGCVNLDPRLGKFDFFKHFGLQKVTK